MPDQTEEKVAPLSIRIQSSQRSLIERAAQEAGTTVSDFVRDAALREAQTTIPERTGSVLDPKAWGTFIEALDASPPDNPRLRNLMTRKAPWETP